MATLTDEQPSQSIGASKPIAALCVLCHDADAVLPFYRDVLGFEPRRAEESFYHFAKRGSGTSFCLWEIGHVASHTVYGKHSVDEIPNKFIVTLTLPSRREIDDLHSSLNQAGLQILSQDEFEGAYGFFFIDPCSVIWNVRVAAGQPGSDAWRALDRITLVCQDVEKTQRFYEDSLGFPRSDGINGLVNYASVSDTALSLWDIASAAKVLGLPSLTDQQTWWSATTLMTAYSFDTLSAVQEQYERLAEAGVSFDEIPQFFDWDFNACYFRDPENTIWELFETPSNIEERMLPQTDKR
ncbi:MAG: VOC family protein [Burkholderiaceae bacterium]